MKTRQAVAGIVSFILIVYIYQARKPGKRKVEDGVEILTDFDLDQIEKRFERRRAKLRRICGEMGRPVPDFAHINDGLFWEFNQIFHDPSLNISGCIAPKTGSTSWGHFWWGMSKFDGVGFGFYDSWQSQGNKILQGAKFVGELKKMKPEVLILSMRHPIERLVSGWNNILCNENCRDEARRKYSQKVVNKFHFAYEKYKSNLTSFTWSFDHSNDTSHMMPFTNLVDMLNADTVTLEQLPSVVDIHFKSYDSLCHICDLPYKFIVKLETFAEDYQFLMRKMGYWEGFNEKHKHVGVIKGTSSEISVFSDWFYAL